MTLVFGRLVVWISVLILFSYARLEAQEGLLAERLAKSTSFQFVAEQSNVDVKALNFVRDKLPPFYGASFDDDVGLPVLSDCILVRLRENATELQLRAMMERQNLTEHQGVPLIPGLNVVPLRSAEPTLDRLSQQAKRLIDFESDIVSAASLNSVLAAAEVPPSKPQVFTADLVWSWVKRTANDMRKYGNDSLLRTRFPAAWNFGTQIKPVSVAVLDVGYAKHEDIAFTELEDFPPGPNHRDNLHGLHVMGIIAASHEVKLGNSFIDGACRHCKLVAGCVQGTGTHDRWLLFSSLLITLDAVRTMNPPPKVVNLSLGYNWTKTTDGAGLVQENRDKVVQAAGIAKQVIEAYERAGIVIVSAAGNDAMECKWSTPLNYAAMNGNYGNVLIVEALEHNEERWSRSNFNGDVAAPGTNIISLAHVDELGSTWEPKATVSLKNGTSCAAPLVTALVAEMFAYNEKLEAKEVVTILKESSQQRKNRKIDAFDAMLRAHPDSLLHLADLDGDGMISNNDFLEFEKRMQDISADENFWPREDLNGDGKLSRNDRVDVWISKPGQQGYSSLTDKEVLELANALYGKKLVENR